MRTSRWLWAPLGVVMTVLLFISACRQAPRGEQAENAENAAANVAEASANMGAAQDGPEVAVPLTPDGDVTFTSIGDAHQPGETVQGALREGTPVPLNSAEWAASFLTEFVSGGASATCTSAMIGPGVMLTAAHCIPSSRKISFAYKGVTYMMSCTRHPKWESGEDSSADYGLCALDPGQGFKPPDTFRYEMVDRTPIARLAAGIKVVLTGFGCTSANVDEGRIDRRYRIGSNIIAATSETRTPRTYPANYYGPNGQRNNLFTAEKGANICPGDSGGPAFLAGANPTDPRRIIGVNSRVFFADSGQSRYGASLIASTGSADFDTWARKWLADRNLAACGLAGAPRGCRI